MNTYPQQFIRSINFVLDPRTEGGLSMDPNDPGNWTGGSVGVGEMLGTKFGISAAAYPMLDIKSLSRDDAVAIYFRDYWSKIRGDDLPPRVAGVILDSAVNQGPGTAVKLLQTALGLKGQQIDGSVGPGTIAAARGVDQDDLVPEILALRALRYTKAPAAEFARDGKGWFIRLFRAQQDASRP